MISQSKVKAQWSTISPMKPGIHFLLPFVFPEACTAKGEAVTGHWHWPLTNHPYCYKTPSIATCDKIAPPTNQKRSSHTTQAVHSASRAKDSLCMWSLGASHNSYYIVT